MKLTRVGDGCIGETKTIGPHTYPVEADFKIRSFGKGERNTSDFVVTPTLDDALAVIRFYARQGNRRAQNIVADLTVAKAVRKQAKEARRMVAGRPETPADE